ncbi:hypothetical protein ZWY2020_005935 [Hordeum vulgare]|nr:hypothetical protein ZWY2020_005935 [Hordeum vulgare]
MSFLPLDRLPVSIISFPAYVPSASQEQPAAEASQGGADEVRVDGLPGCARAFEICAKFCYGMVVTLNPYNVVAARCAAEHLGMTEDVDKSNLVFKIEVFLNSDVFRSWKDSIIALQSTVALLPWSEELRLVARCVDSIAAKATASPGSVVWSYTYNRKAASSDEIVEARRCSSSSPAVPRDWWVEDLCELDVELYKRVMVAVKSRGDRLPPDVVAPELPARRHPADDDDACALEVLETMVWIMPSEGEGSSPCGCWCLFLLNLLKLAVLVGAGNAPESIQGGEEEDLELMDVKKLSKEASIHAAQNDRLPLRVVVQVLFFEQMRAAAAGSASAALLLAAAGDVNAHLELDDNDGGGDCWKNRALALALPEPPTPSAALRKQIGSMSLKLVGEERRRAEDVVSDGRRLARSASIANQSSRMSLSSRSRRIFDRLWVVGKPPGPGEVVCKSSDTSGSSQSPRSSGKPLGSQSRPAARRRGTGATRCRRPRLAVQRSRSPSPDQWTPTTGQLLLALHAC